MTDQRLSFVKPAEGATANFLLYGPAGSGKSVGAGSAPGPILYLNADLPTATRLVHRRFSDKIQELPVESLQTLIEVGTEVQQHAKDWGTVVLDTVGDTYRRIIEAMSGRAIRPKLQEYGDTGVHLERFCRFMCEADLNFVVLCHEVMTKDEETGSHERLPWTGTSNPALGSKLMGMVDIVGYTAVLETDDEGGGRSYIAQLVDGRGRRGKDRFDVLGPWRPVDLTEWVDLIEAPEEQEAATPVAA